MWSQFHGGVDSHRAVCAADDAAAITAMQQQMAAINAEGAYLVSNLLYRLKEDQLSVWQTH